MVTLDSIVRNVMIGKAYSEDSYMKYLQYATRGLRTMNQKAGTPKTIRLEVRDNLTAKLPNDFINYTKIGVCIGGELYTMGYNSDLCRAPLEIEDCEPREIASGGTTVDVGFYFYNYISDENTSLAHNGRMFGLGIPRNGIGEYFVDTKLGQVQFGVVPTGDIFMEYVSNGLTTEDGEVWIDELLTEPMIAWVKYCEAEDDPRSTEAKVERFRSRYTKALNDYKLSRFSFTFDEFDAAARSSYKLSPKR